jgi:hypothetical protein
MDQSVPAAVWMKFAAPMLATSILGAISQRRWRRAGPVVVAGVVIAIAFAWSSWISRARGYPDLPVVHLVAAGLGSSCAGVVLVALGRLPIAVRLVAGVVAGGLATLVGPLAVVTVGCAVYAACP